MKNSKVPSTTGTLLFSWAPGIDVPVTFHSLWLVPEELIEDLFLSFGQVPIVIEQMLYLPPPIEAYMSMHVTR